MESTENDKMMTTIEKNLKLWISRSKSIESRIYDMGLQVTELENESQSRKSLLQTLQQDFNYDRNDLQTIVSLQRDYDAESYIKQLENTLDVVMDKYRNIAQNQIAAANKDAKNEFKKQIESCHKCRSTIDQSNTTINALIKMMDGFLTEGNQITNHLLHENMSLKTENEGLRKIISITEKYGIKEDNNNNKVDG